MRPSRKSLPARKNSATAGLTRIRSFTRSSRSSMPPRSPPSRPAWRFLMRNFLSAAREASRQACDDADRLPRRTLTLFFPYTRLRSARNSHWASSLGGDGHCSTLVASNRQSLSSLFAAEEGPRMPAPSSASSREKETRKALRLSSRTEMARKSASDRDRWLSTRASQAWRQATHSSGRSWSLHEAIGKSAKAGSCFAAAIVRGTERAARDRKGQ